MIFFSAVMDFFLPRLCLSCSDKLDVNEKYVCPACRMQLKFADNELIDLEYSRKFESVGIISDFRSLYIFEKDKQMQQIVHSLKYNGKFKAGIFLGENSGQAFLEKLYDWEIDVLIPVPLHRLKELQRGYNQSSYIAEGIRRISGIPVANKAVTRKKNTHSQTTMNLREREENIKEAFIVKKPAYIKGKSILLIDDVITTGSTINECGRVLKENGAYKIYALSAAIAELPSDIKEPENELIYAPQS